VSTARARRLHSVPSDAPAPARFCGYCAHRPEQAPAPASRVCPRCRMGLLVKTDAAMAPGPREGFVIVDAAMGVRAVSATAERLLDVAETDAVDERVDGLVVPADPSPGARARFHALLVAALRDGEAATEVVLRPARVFGVRYQARIGRCDPGPAVLVVLSPLR
jgi:hypothetical protein